MWIMCVIMDDNNFPIFVALNVKLNSVRTKIKCGLKSFNRVLGVILRVASMCYPQWLHVLIILMFFSKRVGLTDSPPKA